MAGPEKRGRPLVGVEDADLWRRVTRRVRPLADRPPLPPEVPDLPADADPEAPPRLHPPRRRAAAPEKAAPPAPPLLPGSTAGVDRRTAERFKRGRMEIEARLDLHGLTREAAHAALSGFLCRAADQGKRTVLVITGKGTAREGAGVLRAAVPRWLNEAPIRSLVLSFTPARPQDGGEGALYLYLKRNRNKT